MMDTKSEPIETNNQELVQESDKEQEVAPPISEEELAKIKQEIIETKEDANNDFKKASFVTAINKYSICKINDDQRH
jgi:hypothetical protein